MRTISISYMDIGDGFKYYVERSQRVQPLFDGGFSFDTLIDPLFIELTDGWLKNGKVPTDK